MARLIDADDILPKTFICDEVAEVRKFIEQAPTVDAVEVVRCKDCRDCMMCYPEKQPDKDATQAWICDRFKRYCRPDDFCSYGERREGNA